MLLPHVQTETTCIPFVYNKNKLKLNKKKKHQEPFGQHGVLALGCLLELGHEASLKNASVRQCRDVQR